MHRFFVDQSQIYENHIIIQGEDVNHIKNVLRLKKGDEIIICNGQSDDFYCIINTIESQHIIADINEKNPSHTELNVKMYLFQGLPKKDKMDLIIQKAVELGVFEIIPVINKRTIVKFNDKKIKQRLERWHTIAESAAKQARRGIIPKVKAPLAYEEALKYASKMDNAIIAYEKADHMQKTKEILNQLKGESIGVFIGPEGGFDDMEIQNALANKVQPITLGKRILRTETAGIAILSIIMLNAEED